MLCGTRDQAGQSCTCDCNSGASNTSCCCFCHNGCTTGKFSGECSKACPGCSAHTSQTGQECGLQNFCKSIQSLKVPSKSSDMKCCNSGAQCHCQLDPSSPCHSNCCEDVNKSVKCLIRRLVKFFCDLDSHSGNFFKSCCDLLCVAKTCYFLWDFYNKRNQNECKTCKSGGSSGKCLGSKITLTSGSSNQCCGGNPSDCSKSNCCLGCQECDAIKFRKALQDLKYSSPCGHDLWRTLKDFLDCCFRIFRSGHKNIIEEKVRALQENCKCKDATKSKQSPPSPCSCCKPGSYSDCKACKALFADSSLKSLFRQEYFSAYSSKAKWDLLCSPGSPCSGCSKSSPRCHCHSGFTFNTSCNGSCCPDCDVRKAAKIFLGFLPCLYYGLKILYDRSKYDSGFAGWHDISVYSNDNPSSGLAKFLYAWGYGLDPLKTKKGFEFSCILGILYGSSGNFKSLLDFVSEKYFSIHVSDASKSHPTTVRSMLLWLYGLRFQKHFSDLVENCESLCSPFGNSFHPDAFCYYIHASCFLLPVSVISTVQHSHSHVSTFFSTADSEWKSFSYPEDPSELLEKLCEYVRKVFVALNFLYFQCKLIPDQGGWRDCAFGRQCAEKFQENSSTSGSSSPVPPPSCSCSGHETYLCSTKSGNPIHDHCLKGSCRGSGSVSCSDPNSVHPQSNGKPCTPCPHPLMRFLIDDSSDSDSKSQDYPFGLSDITPMGFSPDKLSSTARDGHALYYVLHVFCTNGFYPLTRLLQFSLCVSQRPPETLGELFAFFFRFSESDVFKNFGDYVDGEPGWYRGKALKDAVQGFYGSKESHKNSSHPSDLRSLIACPAPKASSTCGQYLHPLTYNAYNKNIFIDAFLDTYLSWVCYSAENFKKKLEDFYNEASTKFKSCCSTGSCEKIVTCPCALPFLYSFGFGFWSPNSLNCESHGSSHTGQEKDCTRKSCKDFVTQLGKVLEENSPLGLLIKQIEKFLWHIRFPFFFGFLYVWFFVLSYFFYVILIKLDT
ncbi:variant erythrocyte surface antigen-1 family protein, partial [Babesia divergens]